MTREIGLSVALHLLIIAALLISAPFGAKKQSMFDEVVKVTLTAPSAVPSAQPPAPAPIAVPQAEVDESFDVPISKPDEVKEAAKLPDKPKDKPKPKPKPKPAQQPTKPAENTDNQEAGGANSGREVDTPGGAGSPFAGATVDNVSFDYPYWFTQAFNKIGGNYHIRVNFGQPLVCTIYFQVIRSGRVIEARVENSSGVPEFDEICLRAVENSAPFPPLPRSFIDEIIGITLPFKYDPR